MVSYQQIYFKGVKNYPPSWLWVKLNRAQIETSRVDQLKHIQKPFFWENRHWVREKASELLRMIKVTQGTRYLIELAPGEIPDCWIGLSDFRFQVQSLNFLSETTSRLHLQIR